MAERKKRGRAAKAAYFVSAGNGNYIYTGPLYSLSEANLTAKQAGARRLLFGGSVFALSLICGLIPVPGLGNTFYVIIPYALSLIFAAVLLWKAARIAYWRYDDLREYVYDSTVTQLPVLTLFCAVFAGAAVIGEALCLMIEGVDTATLPAAIFFIIAHAAIATLAPLWRRFEAALQWVKKPV